MMTFLRLRSPDIYLWNVVTFGQYAVSDTREIGFDCFRADVNEHNLKSPVACIKHYLKIVFAGKCHLDGKAFLIAQQLLRNLRRLTAKPCSRRRW